MNGKPYPSKNREEIWLALAELFFLDTEPQQHDFDYAVRLLKEAGWNREETERTLIELIAPQVAGNLGYLVWPVICP
jgi:hypothetical protein